MSVTLQVDLSKIPFLKNYFQQQQQNDPGPPPDPPQLPMNRGQQAAIAQMAQQPPNIMQGAPEVLQNQPQPAAPAAPALPHETKGHKLLQILMGGIAGAAIGAGAGADEYARTGRSGGFGTGLSAGFQGAEQLPFIRAMRQQQLQRGNLENQRMQAQTAAIPGMNQARLDELKARTGYYQAGSSRRGYLETKGGTLELDDDGKPAGIVPGTEPQNKPNLQESTSGRRQIIQEMHDQLGRDYALSPSQEQEYILNGKFNEPKSSNPNAYADFSSNYPQTPRGRSKAARDWAAMNHPDRAGQRENTKQKDAADAESIAASIMQHAGGDPDKALTAFDQALPQVTDQRQKSLAPQIRDAIKARKRINPVPRKSRTEQLMELMPPSVKGAYQGTPQ
jgi:hypothetical protein